MIALADKRKAQQVWLARVTLKVRQLHARTAAGAVEMGKLVLEVKDKLQHGEFIAWVEEALPFDRRTASSLMNVARHFGEIKRETVSHFDVTAMYELATSSAPQEARVQAIEAAERGEWITRARAIIIIATIPRPERAPRRGYFESNPDPKSAAAAAMVRGVLVERLERAFTEGKLGKLIGRDHPDPEVRDRANELYHEIALALFPEEYDDLALVPDQPKRVNAANYQVLAEMMAGG